MYLVIRVLATLLLSCGVAYADVQVDCSNSDNTVSWQFFIKGTPSARLAADIVYSVNGTGAIISTARVAQYHVSNQLISITVDDVAENVTHTFTSRRPKAASFSAKLKIVNPAAEYSLTCVKTTI